MPSLRAARDEATRLVSVALRYGAALGLLGCHYDLGSPNVRAEGGAGGAGGRDVGPNSTQKIGGGGGHGGEGGSWGEGGHGGEGGSGGEGGRGGEGGTNGGTGGMQAAGGESTGGAPSAMGGDGGPPRWCDGHLDATFCADFDGAATVEEFLKSWTKFSINNALFSFDSTAGVPSPPHALQIQTTSDRVDALAINKIPAFVKLPRVVRLEFELRIDAGDYVGPGAGAVFAGILTGERVADGMIGIELAQGSLLRGGYVEPNAVFPSETNFRTAVPPQNDWLGRYAVEIVYSTPSGGTRTGCAQIFRDDVQQLSQCMSLPPSLTTPPFISIALGMYSGGTGATGNVQLRFDNVLLTVK